MTTPLQRTVGGRRCVCGIPAGEFPGTVDACVEKFRAAYRAIKNK